MNIIPHISWRILTQGSRLTLISVLNWLSVTGVMVGTALLIIVLSVFNGFFNVVQSMLLSEDPELRIARAESSSFHSDPEILKWLEPDERVISVYSLVEGRALLVHEDGENEVIGIKGAESLVQKTGTESTLYPVLSGEEELSVRNRRPGALMTINTVHRFGLNTGDRFGLITAEGMRRSLTTFSSPGLRAFELRGVLPDRSITGEEMAVVELAAAQRLFGLGQEINAYQVTLADPDQAERMKQDLLAEFGEEWEVQTWYDLNRPLYDVMRLEKWSSYAVLMIIVLVAVLNIVGSLTMIVLQKRRDIGVLMTLGLTPEQVRMLFLWHGAVIGVIGGVFGGGLGLLFTYLQDNYGLLKLSSAFLIDSYPVAVQGSDVALVLFGTLSLCLLASLYPAMRASKVLPAVAVQTG